MTTHPNSRFRRPGLRLTLLPTAALLFLATASISVGGEIQPPGNPSADFTRYVAVGDSITAGYASGGLAETQQIACYPILINTAAGGPTFEQPLVSEPGITAQLALVGLSAAGPQLMTKNGQGTPLNLMLPRPYNNLGVPGARVADTVNTVTGGAHDLVLRGLGTALQQAVSLQPTFATVWIGNNDVLAAATSGIVIDGVTLTPVAAFQANYRTILQTLAATGAGIVVANIPDITALPYVTTIDPFVINPADGSQIFLLGDDGAGGVRQLTAADRVLLPASALLAQGVGLPVAAGGTGQPLPDSAILDSAESAAILERTGQLNAVIATEAAAVGAAVVPVNTIFNDIAANGVPIGGVTFRADFLTGGLFTYDGVHPTATAHGLVANAFIDAINARFDVDIAPISLMPYAFGGVGAPDNDLGQVPTAANVVYTLAARDRVLEAVGSPTVFELEQIKSGAVPAPSALHDRFDAGGGTGARAGKRADR